MTGSREDTRSYPTRVAELMQGDSSGLGPLLREARKLEKLNQALKTILEPSIQDKVSVAAIHDRLLVLTTSSGALATRLRMDSDALIASLNSVSARKIHAIQVKIAPESRVSSQPRKARQLPKIARESLLRFAEDTGDSELLTALAKPKPGQ